MASKLFAVVLFAVLMVHVFAATVYQVEKDLFAIDRIRRGADDNDPECLFSTPCGWGVYTRFTRQFSYFMKNKCYCPERKKCVRTDDDLSVSAYVYRCKYDTNENNVKS